MLIDIDDGGRFVEIWLDHSDPPISQTMEALIAKYHREKYTVAVYRSGDRDLASCVVPLLRQNL